MLDEDIIKLLLIEDEEYDVVRVRNTIKLSGDRIKIVDVVSDGNDALNFIREKVGFYDVVVMGSQPFRRFDGREID